MRGCFKTLRASLFRALSLAILLAFLQLGSPSIFAYGQSSCGSCLVPPEMADQARMLEDSFKASDHDTLSQQSWAGTLCKDHPCGDDVTEERADKLLRDFFSRKQREEDLALIQEQRAEDHARAKQDRLISWAGIIVGLAGVIIAGIALLLTYQANQIARLASERSIRNEVHIERWKDKGAID